jgi:hypothetical protein
MFGNVKPAYEFRLEATRSPAFEALIKAEVVKKRIERVRIHDSGDFYSEGYLYRWIRIAAAMPDVEFYAYTKMVTMVRYAMQQPSWPSNFTIIFSQGGTEDKLIDVKTERHSRVFETLKELKAAGYADASNDDAVAVGLNKRIGLIYHGTKNIENTDWRKVKQAA